MNNKITAIIVSNQSYKEKDALVRMINEEGEVITMIAKGANAPTSKYNAYLQPFNICEIDYHHKDQMGVFISASLKQRIEYRDFHTLAAASFILQSMEAINKLEPSTYPLWTCVQYLHILEQSMYSGLLKFCFDLFEKDGRQLVVDECVNCGSLQISGFSISAGGFCCKTCSVHERIDLSDIDVLRALRCVSKAPLELTYKCSVSALSMSVIKLFVVELKESYPLAMKSWKFMDELV
jgi:DNA repair protein RecO